MRSSNLCAVYKWQTHFRGFDQLSVKELYSVKNRLLIIGSCDGIVSPIFIAVGICFLAILCESAAPFAKLAYMPDGNVTGILLIGGRHITMSANCRLVIHNPASIGILSHHAVLPTHGARISPPLASCAVAGITKMVIITSTVSILKNFFIVVNASI